MGLNRRELLRIRIAFDIRNLREYVRKLEDVLRNELEKFNLRVEEETSKLPEHQKEEFYNFCSGEYWQLTEVFPHIFRSSLFVTCYSFFEHELNELCGYFHKHQSCPIKINDLKGDGIFRAKIYLKKVVGIEFPDQSTSWEDIVDYNKIRNIIVHNNGKLDDSQKSKRIEEFIKKKSSIKLNNLKFIKFNDNFSLEIISTIKEFLDELIKVIPK